MSDILDQALGMLNSKLAGNGFDGTAKIAFGDEGSMIIDGDGARLGDDEADVTLTADADVLQAIFDGDMNPTTAFMSGKLKIDGDMGAAMRLASVLG